MAIRQSTAAPLRGAKRWAFLERATTIRVASQAGEGRIYVSPLWYVVRDRKIYIALDQAGRHARNVQEGGRLSAVVDQGDEFATAHGVEMEGTAVPVEDDDFTEELHQMMLSKYFYEGHPYLEEYIDLGRYYTRKFYEIVPERTIGWDSREGALIATLEQRYLPQSAVAG
jgi:nitroimidazol reductase NimA-like FMN-containing flavoprotein (pyridoxamine 5'-phosphate oxidase superfamily)